MFTACVNDDLQTGGSQRIILGIGSLQSFEAQLAIPSAALIEQLVEAA